MKQQRFSISSKPRMIMLKQFNSSCAKQIYRHCVKSRCSNSLSMFNAQQPNPSRLLSVTNFTSFHQHFAEQDVMPGRNSNTSTSGSTEFNMKKHQTVPLRLIENKFVSLVQSNELSGNAAAELLTMCGCHTGIGDMSKRNRVVDKIFNAAQNKTVDLFNSLLSIYIKNNRPFNSNDILKQMKASNLKPNETTYANLVAGHCMKGDVNAANQIVQFLKQSEMKIPSDIYGYLAYGMCIAGNPQYGFQILEHFLKSNKWISSSSFALLCRGIAASNDLELFDKSINTFVTRLDQPLSASNVISIFEELQKNDHGKEIGKLFDFTAFDESYMELTVDCLYFRQSPSSSSFLKNLLARYIEKNGKHLNSYKELKALEILLLPSFRKDTSLDGLWEEMMMVKPLFNRIHDVKYMTLSLLLLECSPSSKPFADKLVDNKFSVDFETIKKLAFFKTMSKQKKERLQKEWKYVLSPPAIPTESKKNVRCLERQNNFSIMLTNSDTRKRSSKLPNVAAQYHYSEIARKLLSKLQQSSKADAPEILSSLLKEVLSSFYFNPTVFVNDISKIICGDAQMDANISTKLLFSSFASLFNDGLHGWQLGNIQKLLDELHNKGLKLCKQEIDFFNQELKEEYKSLSGLITTDTSFSQHFQFSDHNQLKSNHLATLMNDLKRAKIQFDQQVPNDIVCDIILDGYRHLSVKSFNKLLSALNPHLKTLPCIMLNFIFCFYVQHGYTIKAQSLCKRVPRKISLNVETIPSDILQDAEKQDFLMNYLKHEVGEKEAVTMLYCSFLKAGLTTQATQVFKSHSNCTMSQEELLKLLFILSANGDLGEWYDTIVNDCRHLEKFDHSQLCLSVVENFLTKGKLEEAEHFINKNVISTGSLPLIQRLRQLYSTYIEVAPLNLYDSRQHKLARAVTAENMSLDEVLAALQPLQISKSFAFLFTINPLHCLLFTKTPADKYDFVYQQVTKVNSHFKPHRQSRILIDRMQKLVALSQFDEVIAYASKSLEASNENNMSVWEKVIEIFGNAGLQHDKWDMLKALQNSSLLKHPKTQDMVEGYLLYHNLANGESLNNKKSVKLAADLLIQVQSIDAFGKLFDIAISECSMHADILTSAFASAIVQEFHIERVSHLLSTHDLKPEHYVDLAAKSYAMVSNCEDLVRVDSFLRKLIDDDDIDLNVILNDKAFRQFCKISMSSTFDDSTLKYLVDSYHKIPSHRNSALAKYIYQELCTTFKYM